MLRETGIGCGSNSSRYPAFSQAGRTVLKAGYLKPAFFQLQSWEAAIKSDLIEQSIYTPQPLE